MLQKMRDNTQSLGFKILVGALIFVLAVFGFGAFNLFVNPDPEIASVNGDAITEGELAAETERARIRLLGQLAEDADPASIDVLQLQTQVLDQLINRRLLEQATDSLGLTTSKARVDRAIIDNPGFQVDGRYDPDTFVRVVRQFGYTPAAFGEVAGKDMAIEQMQRAVMDSAVVPDWQLRWLVALMQQRRDLAYLPMTRAHFAERAEISEEEMQRHYDENRLAYQTEESVDVAFVELSWQDLMEAATADVEEDEIVSAYEAEKQAAAADEQRRSSHILLRLTDDRDEQAAIAEARQLRAQLNTGADFAELAKAHSDDPGSAANGGDLGPAARGVFVPEFEEALFALEVGELSEPVVSQFGVHLIRLDEIIVPTYPSLDDMREQIVARLAENGARERFVEKQRELDGLAFEQNDSLDGLAEAFGIPVRNVSGVTRKQGPEQFANGELRDAAFSEDVLERGFNSPAISYEEGRAVVVRLVERHVPREQSLEEVRDVIEATLRAQKAEVALDAAFADALEQLRGGAAVADVAQSHGLEWQTHTLASNSEPGIPQEVLRAAFALPPPDAGDKQIGSATLLEGGHAIITITRVENGDIETMTEQQVDGLARFLRSRTGNLDFSALFESVREDASIDRPSA